MNETTPQKNKDHKSKIFLALALLFLAGIIGLVIWIIPKINDYEQMLADKEVQKQEIQKSLDELMIQHDSIKAKYGELSDSLRVKDSIIKKNAEELRKLLNYKWEYRKAKKKLERLREVAQTYVHRLDSLYNVTKELKAENKRIKQEYTEQVKKTKELEETNTQLEQKVEDAAYLKGTGIQITTIRFTRSGRARETNKASKVKKVKICFTLVANPLVEKDLKTLYVRIAKPNQEIITKDQSDKYTFKFQGSTLQYTALKDFQYDKEDMELCVNILIPPKERPLETGKYIATLYLDDHVIGEKAFELR